ncbi:MAG: C40 family peptidase [Bacteroides sp.]|nr:C40 family peptidase [Barnesiella sp.]MBD5314777.1 C40 family peptidase [Bacteroides sp.]MDE6249347.1 C40 family peptidase [Paramuribaculum sp.]MDE7449655.1 C40 family peptidase [Paramuribaculum sp.]
MNTIYRLIASIILIALGISTSPAQKSLPADHNATANKESRDQHPMSFAEKAYEEARENSPFAKVVPVKVRSQVHINLAAQLTDYAAKFLGTRYRAGGSSKNGFDCSGFTSHIFANFGIALNRDSRAQYTQGEEIDLADVRPGDLLFFSSARSGKGRIGHVAMVVSVDPETNACKFIHASSSKGITYDRFPDGGYYSRHFVGAKRIIGAEDMKIQASL